MSRVARVGRPSPWLLTPVLVGGTWLLSAQSPPSDAQLAALERRVTELEARISKAGNVTQIKAPFIVMGQDGKPVLEVVTSANIEGTGAVLIARHPQSGGAVYTLNGRGDAQAAMFADTKGVGVVYVKGEAGKITGQISGDGRLASWNSQGKPVAAIGATPEGRGRLVIWDGDTRVVLIEDSAGAGSLSLMKGSGGQAIANLGIGAGGSGRLAVMGSQGKIGAAVIGELNGGGLVGVAKSSGQTVAQMGVTSGDIGSVQIFSATGQNAAVMSMGGPGDGGIFQVLHGGVVKATIGTAEGGGGMMQLISSQGVPTVEAGSMASGRGIVRTGPFWDCSPTQAATPVMSVGRHDCIVGKLAEK